MRGPNQKFANFSWPGEHPSTVKAAAVTDAELGLLARDGDVQALAALLERCRPSLYATAVGLLANRADALDAVQDTCVVALLRLGELRDVAAVRGWLHSVLHACLMQLRQQREVVTTDIEVRETVPGPQQVLDQHAMRDWVWQALDRLAG